jgi:hypothetical protein
MKYDPGSWKSISVIVAGARNHLQANNSAGRNGSFAVAESADLLITKSRDDSQLFNTSTAPLCRSRRSGAESATPVQPRMGLSRDALPWAASDLWLTPEAA